MQERKTFCLADTWHWQQFETGPDHADYAVEDLRGAGREADNDAGRGWIGDPETELSTATARAALVASPRVGESSY
jgi:hypothetical protein